MADDKRSNTLPAEETALFCEQVAMVLKAGIPLYEGMETLAASYAGGKYAAQFSGMRNTVLRTGSLYDAVEQAGVFPAYFTGMVRIGERAGKLDEVLDALASYYYSEAEVKTSVKNAVLYPAVLVCMLAVVVGILIVSVLPVFNQVFASLGVSDMSASGSAMRVGMGVGKAVLIVIGLVLSGLIVLLLLLRGKNRAKAFDWLCRAVPPVGAASEQLSAGRLCSVLSVMLAAGCGLDTAMELAPEVVTDAHYRLKIEKARALLTAGKPVAEAFSEAKLFSGMYEKMVRFGAAAGQLDGVFLKLRDAYMREADAGVAALVSMIEPALVTILSVVIGGILLTVMLPLLSILSAIV